MYNLEVSLFLSLFPFKLKSYVFKRLRMSTHLLALKWQQHLDVGQVHLVGLCTILGL